ncbi:MAG: hypothetical protein QM811_04020 [Pirellulales bacterium]
MVALGKLAGPDHIAGMAAGILKAEPGVEREAAERAIALAAGRAADPAQRADPLLAVLKSSHERDRLALLPAVGRLGGKSALSVIQTELTHADPQRHAAGLVALGNWPDASVSAALMNAAVSDPQPELRAKRSCP